MLRNHPINIIEFSRRINATYLMKKIRLTLDYKCFGSYNVIMDRNVRYTTL